MPAIKALTIDFDLIAQSMRDLARETSDYYLDRTTGRVICLSRDLILAFSKDDGVERPSVPEWEAPMIPLAREIVLLGSENFIRIPEAFGRPEHGWMLQFANDFRTQKLKQKMIQALRGRGSCRRFKEILSETPEDLRRWSVFLSRCWEERIQAWMEGMGILPVRKRPNRSRAATK